MHALLTLAPHPFAPSSLVLILAGTDARGLEKAFSMFPVRTGTRLPEWVVLGEESGWKGEGGIVAGGWWGRGWEWSDRGMCWLEE